MFLFSSIKTSLSKSNPGSDYQESEILSYLNTGNDNQESEILSKLTQIDCPNTSYDCNGTLKITHNFNLEYNKCAENLILDYNSFDCGYIVPCNLDACKLNDINACDGTTKKIIEYSCDEKKGCISSSSVFKNSMECGYKSPTDIRLLGEYNLVFDINVGVLSATKKDSYNWTGFSGNEYTQFAEDGKTFLFLNVKLINQGKKDFSVSPLNFVLTDSTNSVFKNEFFSTSDYDRLDSVTIILNTNAIGFLFYEIPKNESGLKLVYKWENYPNDDIYGTWNLNTTTATNNNIICSSGKIEVNNICIDCGGEGEPCCENNNCDYSLGCSNGTCDSCGGENENPCSTGCSYGYDEINGECVESCGYQEIRQNGVCVDCGKNNQLPCSTGCSYGYEEINNVCIEACGIFEIRVNSVCVDCGNVNDPCCTNSECILGVCNNGQCETCGFLGEQCCSNNSCFLGNCVSGECVYS